MSPASYDNGNGVDRERGTRARANRIAALPGPWTRTLLSLAGKYVVDSVLLGALKEIEELQARAVDGKASGV